MVTVTHVYLSMPMDLVTHHHRLHPVVVGDILRPRQDSQPQWERHFVPDGYCREDSGFSWPSGWTRPPGWWSLWLVDDGIWAGQEGKKVGSAWLARTEQGLFNERENTMTNAGDVRRSLTRASGGEFRSYAILFCSVKKSSGIWPGCRFQRSN